MSANSRFAVAIHILAVLGYLEGEGIKLVSSHQIARSVNVNAVVIRSMLRALKKAGLVSSREGRGGGVSLAKRPSQISLHDIYSAVVDRGVFAIRKKASYKHCPVSRGMKAAFGALSHEVDGAIARVLGRTTLEDFMSAFLTKA